VNSGIFFAEETLEVAAAQPDVGSHSLGS
jgi:hypothetical protein